MTHASCTPALPILYSFRRCPYAMRARLAIATAGTRCTLREVVLRDKPAALLQASPKATVPVLVLPDGRVIDESLDIMLWALTRHDPHDWLSPAAISHEDMMALIAACDTHFKMHLDRYKYPNRFDLESGLADRDIAARWLLTLDARLASDPWLGGAQACLADMAIAPFVRQYAHTDRDWFDAQGWSALRKWLNAFIDDPLFAAIMHKYPAWEPGQAPVPFPQVDCQA